MKKQLIYIAFILTLILSACEPTKTNITYRFETDGGTPITEIILTEDERLSLPDEPTKEGYTFSGWYLDQHTLDLPFDSKLLDDYIHDGLITLYAKWESIEVFYDIIWKMPDGTILRTDSVLEDTLPTADGLTPNLESTDDETYTFTGWTPEITEATQDQVYVATFETHIIEKPTFTPSDLNDLFGYDIYQYIPEITSDDYEIFNYSEGNFKEVYIDVFTWDEQDSFNYMDELDLLLSYDNNEDSWILGDYYLYVYEDTLSYPNKTVYGIGIYGESDFENYYDNFLSVIDDIALNFSDDQLKTLIPNFMSIEQLILLSDQPSKIEFSGQYTGTQSITDQNQWINLLITNGFTLDNELSSIQGQDVYTYEINSDSSYAVIFEINQNELYFTVWSFDPTVELKTPDQLDYMQSINAYEYSKFSDSGLPSKGTFDVLVIPIEFSEQPFPSDYLENLELTFNGTPEETGWHSVSSYYSLSSYGLLNMSFDIVEKYESTLTKSFIESKGGDGDQYAIYNALLALDPTIDFSKYDTNQDGLIDSIYFIYSVDYDYDTNPWWAWVFSAIHGEASKLPKLDGLDFEYYAWMSYEFSQDPIYGSDGQIVNAETFIHETGHLFGGVDLYSYTETYGPIGGMGMMDYNVGDHDPIHKLLFGWIKPYLATSGTYEVTLESYALDQDGIGSTIVIPYTPKSFVDGDAFDEFIIIMFYTPEGLYEEHLNQDYVLDHAGIMIYHVDARLYQYASFWDGYFMYNNDGTSDFFASLLEIDDNQSLSRNTITMDDVLTSGSTDLSNYDWHQGGAINISVELLSVITDDSDEVTFKLTIN